MNVFTQPDFQEYKTKEIVTTDQKEWVPEVTGRFFKRRDGTGREESMGIFYFEGDPVWQAWGYIDEPHCRCNTGFTKEGSEIFGAPGCPEIRRIIKDAEILGFRVGLPTGDKEYFYKTPYSVHDPRNMVR